MKILYAVGFTDWWGNYPPDVLDRDTGKTVGGGEAGALQTAFALAALGHDVTYCSVATPGTHKGVTFKPLQLFFNTYLKDGPWDAVAAWSITWPLTLVQSGEARLLVQQLNDLTYKDGWWHDTDVLVSPSWTHARYLDSFLPAHAKVVQHAVGNGVDLGLFPKDAIVDPAMRPMCVGWWSSPDRGLHHVLKAWPLVRARVPGATLRVFYQVKKYIDNARMWCGRASLLGSTLGRMLRATEHLGVELVDQIPRRALAKEQMQTRVQGYICDPEGFTEGFATSILESLAAGCLPVLRPVDALPELWDGVVRWVNEDTMGEDYSERVADHIVWGLTEWAEDPSRRPSVAEMRGRAEQWPWATVGLEMEVAIKKAIEVRARKAAQDIERAA